MTMFPKNSKEKAVTLIEVIMSIILIIVIYIGATTAQLSSEIFLKNIRTDFEKHLELNNALDLMLRDVRRSYASPVVQSDRLRLITKSEIIEYAQSGNDIVKVSPNLETIAKDARVNFSSTSGLIRITVEEITPDAQKIRIFLDSQAFMRDKP